MLIQTLIDLAIVAPIFAAALVVASLG